MHLEDIETVLSALEKAYYATGDLSLEWKLQEAIGIMVELREAALKEIDDE